MKSRFAHVVTILLFTCLQDSANAASPAETVVREAVDIG